MERMNATEVNVFGGTIVGNLLATVCFGVLTIQISSYYYAFPNDGRLLKFVVHLRTFPYPLEMRAFYGIFAKAHNGPTTWTLYSACGTQALYWRVVTNYGNGLTLGRSTWEFTVFQINTVCASLAVQTFFAGRVYSLSANLYLGMLVISPRVMHYDFVGSPCVTSVRSVLPNYRRFYDALLAYSARAVGFGVVRDFAVLIKEWTWLAVAWLAIQAIADLVIATCMCLLLRHRRTGFQKTDSVINRMVLYTISTGLVTSVLSCILLGMFVKYGFNFTTTIGIPLGTVYSITMLANLHTRTALRAKLDTPTPLELISSSLKKRIRRNMGNHGNEERPQVAKINIPREVIYGANINQKNNDAKVGFAGVQLLP
ncbi:hypothetical protein BS47DRAFT_1363370 [Hydnum rufescens UP504]|uniref:DUF6534 domain-containing protein n=1 Tax=Hydnum rufescens UP504 TaxID=1448309 RepID=A0A9P6AUS1_9AGAM|nr:hypothetical protein BS47DRAFT_1363370 [Hydnum rufescens UP504]